MEGLCMRAIGNVFWFVFGGFLMGLGWWLAGLICAITIIGLPWAKACCDWPVCLVFWRKGEPREI
jgi:uncharacterized membrane protein YccF (DUF307 family)